MSAGALRRALHRPSSVRAATEQRCDLCAAGVLARHRHVLDERRDELLCVCQACALLFHRDAAGRGHYRLVPDRHRRVPELTDLGIPVGLAYFVGHDDGTATAHYPSPAGATRWEVDPATWERVRQRCPEVAGLAPRVEALLVNTARGAREHWIVPVDTCYRLVALVRSEWRGLSGGSRVWPAIDRFFADLADGRDSPLRGIGG
ncbi:DUF5947 family protein [Saccharopolyspora sp. CA-218241]|uniref:DUF5947 family protein n=1 Tax=Saccharopolyspora sp. CA-218241 TaxID=3240027 RepID=UPI003D98284E